MARCVKCGQEAAEPVWAVYADPAFEHKFQTPFPLHTECFNDGEEITPREWVAADQAGDRNVVMRSDENTDNPTVLVEGSPYKRYREVEVN